MSQIKGEISGLNDRMENLIGIIFFVLNANVGAQKTFFTLTGEKKDFSILAPSPVRLICRH